MFWILYNSRVPPTTYLSDNNPLPFTSIPYQRHWSNRNRLVGKSINPRVFNTQLIDLSYQLKTLRPMKNPKGMQPITTPANITP